MSEIICECGHGIDNHSKMGCMIYDENKDGRFCKCEKMATDILEPVIRDLYALLRETVDKLIEYRDYLCLSYSDFQKPDVELSDLFERISAALPPESGE